MAKRRVTTNEIMEFLQEQAVVKADLENFMTKDDGRRLENRVEALSGRVYNLEDQQVKLIQTVESELLAPTLRIDRMEGRLCIVETKLGLAA